MRYDFVKAFTDIDDELIEGVADETQKPVEIRPEKRAVRFGWKKPAAAAACLAAVGAGAVFGIPVLRDAINSSSENDRHLELGHYDNSDKPAKVFESYGLNAANCHVSFTMEEYPGKTFATDENGFYIKRERGSEYTTVINEDSLKSVYLYDATGDGKRDFCITFEYGSGLYKNNYIKIFDLVGDRIYKLSDMSENYVLAGTDDMEFTQTLIPEGFAGANIPEDDLVVFSFGKGRRDIKSLKADGGSFGTPGADGTYGDFELVVSGMFANWDECNPMQLWKSGDGEKTFALPQFPDINIRVSETALDITEGGKPIIFTELNYRDGNVVRYNGVFCGDIDMDGKCELCASYDIDQFMDASLESDTGITVYDFDARQTITTNGFLSGRSWKLKYENGALISSCQSPVLHGSSEIHDETACSPYNHMWSLVKRYRQEYERDGIYEELRNIPGELDLGRIKNGEDYVFEIEEFPGESFRVTPDCRIVDRNGKVIIEAHSLMNGFLYDFNGDGKRDICVTVGYKGVYYVEVYDVASGENWYCYSANPYKESRYLSVVVSDKAVLMVRTINNGYDDWYGSFFPAACTKYKPILEELILIYDCEKLSAGEAYNFSIDEYRLMDLCIEGTEKGAKLCYKQKFYMGTINNTLLEGVLNIYLYDSNANGKRELWMTYLDGDRTAVAAMLPDDEHTMYFSADDGNRRRLVMENDTLKIVSDPISGGAAVTEPLDLGKLIKQNP